MKKIITLTAALLLGFSCTAPQAPQPLPAFPTAEGYGAFTPGGRGGKVFVVTTLNDYGPGSLREAVEAEGPRIVVFNVSGTIELNNFMDIRNPYITIAGQTAPGDGICLKNYPLNIKGTHDVIVRGLKIRTGVDSGLEGSHLDGIEISHSENVIVDHCTVSWSSDEGINSWKGNKNVTVQWCMMSEPLNRNLHEKGEHGFSASLGGEYSSNHHNLFAHGKGRNPSIGGNHQHSTLHFDFRNNVIFNYGTRVCDGKPRSINMVNNYYKPGPATSPKIIDRIARIDNASVYNFQGKWYIEGNVLEGNPAVTADNWNGGVVIDRGLTEEEVRAAEPFEVSPVTTQPAQEALELVLAYVGATPQRRDAQESRIIREVRSGEPTFGDGIIDSPEEVGGYPVLAPGTPWIDTDGDGIPDEWEIANKLNLNDPSDASKVAKNGYTHIENWFNSLLPQEILSGITL